MVKGERRLGLPAPEIQEGRKGRKKKKALFEKTRQKEKRRFRESVSSRIRGKKGRKRKREDPCTG